SADPNGPGVELNFTVLEGPGAAAPHRWHFWLPASHAKRVWRIDALLARAFRRPQAVATPMIGSPTLPQAPWVGTRVPAHGAQTDPRGAQSTRATALRTNFAAA